MEGGMKISELLSELARKQGIELPPQQCQMCGEIGEPDLCEKCEKICDEYYKKELLE